MSKIVRVTTKAGKVAQKLLASGQREVVAEVGAKVELVDSVTGKVIQAAMVGDGVVNYVENGVEHKLRLVPGASEVSGDAVALVADSGAEPVSGTSDQTQQSAPAEDDGKGGVSLPLILLGIAGIGGVAGAAAGGGGGSSTAPDTTPPAVPSGMALAADDDTGSSNSDRITSKTAALTITGTTEAGATVTLSEGSTTLGTGTADSTGKFSIDVALQAGTHSVTATAKDSAGNASAASSALSIVVDTTAPGAPGALALAAADDSGASSTDRVTNQTTALTISGTAEAGSTVTIKDGSTVLGSATATAAGAFTLDVALAAGDHSLTATATDPAGNVSTSSAALAVTVDTTAPNAPTGVTLAAADDTGASNSDGITSQTSGLSINGTAEAGSVVTVKDGSTVIGTATASAGGTFTLDVALAAGNHSLTATATDLAGNVGAASSALAITVDTTAPTAALALASSTLTTGGSTTATITVSEALAAGTLTLDDLTWDAALVAVTGLAKTSDTTYTVNVAPARNGIELSTTSIALKASSYTDVAGNPGGAAQSADFTVDTMQTINIGVAAGPFIKGAFAVDVYGAAGKLATIGFGAGGNVIVTPSSPAGQGATASIGTVSVGAQSAAGSITFNLPNYTGPVLLSLRDADADAATKTFYDEIEGPAYLDTALRAFTTVAPGATVNLAITPLTEAAVRLAEDALGKATGSINSLASTTSVERTALASAEKALGDVLGIDLVNTIPVAVNDNAFAAGSAAAKAYGEVLAGLSQFANEIAGNPGNGDINTALDAYLASVQGTKINADGQVSVHLDLTQVALQIAQLGALIDKNDAAQTAALQAAKDALNAAITAGDADLQAKLDAAKAAFTDALTEISTDLAAETAARIAADNIHTSDIAALRADLTALEGVVDANDAAQTAALNAAKAALNTAIAAVAADLAAETAARIAADNIHTSDIAALRADLTALEGVVDANDAAQTAALNAAKAALDTAIATVAADLAAETAARIAADNIHTSDIATLRADLTVLEGVVDANDAAQTAALNAAKAALDTAIATVAADLAAETAARIAADNIHTSDIATLRADLTALEGVVDANDAAQTAALNAAKAALNTAIAAVAADLAAETAARIAADNIHTSDIATLRADLTVLEGVVDANDAAQTAALNAAKAELNAAIDVVAADLAAEISARAASDTNQQSQIDALRDDLQAFKDAVGDLGAGNFDARIQALELDVAALKVDHTPPVPGGLDFVGLTDTGSVNHWVVTRDGTFKVVLSGDETGAGYTVALQVRYAATEADLADTWATVGSFDPVTKTASQNLITGGLGDGVYQYRAVITDANNNVSYTPTATVDFERSATGSITIDDVTDKNIVNASEVGSGVVITGTVDDPTVEQVTVTINGVDYLVDVEPDGAWSVPVDAVTLAGYGEGLEGISVTYRDSAGNVSAATNGQFEIDTVAPTIAVDPVLMIDDVVNDSEDGSLVISGTVADLGASHTLVGQTVTVTVTGPGGESETLTATVLAGDTWSTDALDVSAWTNGNISISATFDDYAGNPAAAPATHTVALDNQVPTITIDAIATDNVVNNAESTGMVVSGTATDPSPAFGAGVVGQTIKVTVTDDANAANTWTETVTVGAGGAWTTGAYNVSGWADYHTTFTVTAELLTDVAGNPADTKTATGDLRLLKDPQLTSVSYDNTTGLLNMTGVNLNVDPVAADGSSVDNQKFYWSFNTATSNQRTFSAAELTGLDLLSYGTITGETVSVASSVIVNFLNTPDFAGADVATQNDYIVLGAGYLSDIYGNSSNAVTSDHIVFNWTVPAGASNPNFTGGSGDDTITGNEGVNILNGGAGDDLIRLALAQDDSGESYNGGADNDTLEIVGTGLVNLSDDTVTSFETLKMGNGGRIKVTEAQHASFVAGTIDETGTQTVTIAQGSLTTISGDSRFENYILENDNADDLVTFELGSATQNVTGQYVFGNSNESDAVTFDVGSLVYTGSITGNTGAPGTEDGIAMSDGADISGATISGVVDLTLDDGAAVTMTAAQMAAFTGTVTVSAETAPTDEQITLTTVATGAQTLLGPVEKFVLAAGNNSVTTGAAGQTILADALADGDVLTVASTNDVSIYLAHGDLSAGGVTGNVQLVGGSDAQSITTGSGADAITGGAGADLIDVGADSAVDVLNYSTGDTGHADGIATAFFADGDSTVDLDRIQSFKIGDKIHMNTDVFTAGATVSTALLTSVTANNVAIVQGSIALDGTFTANGTGNDYVLQWADGSEVHSVLLEDFGTTAPTLSVDALTDTITVAANQLHISVAGGNAFVDDNDNGIMDGAEVALHQSGPNTPGPQFQLDDASDIRGNVINATAGSYIIKLWDATSTDVDGSGTLDLNHFDTDDKIIVDTNMVRDLGPIYGITGNELGHAYLGLSSFVAQFTNLPPVSGNDTANFTVNAGNLHMNVMNRWWHVTTFSTPHQHNSSRAYTLASNVNGGTVTIEYLPPAV